MSIRFFADHCISRTIIKSLKEEGHIVLKKYLAEYPDMEYYKGKLFLVEVHRIRIRK